jgi:signal transduction histidine kinase
MWGANANLRILKWLAIIMPVAFLVALDVFRHTALEDFHHSTSGFLINYGVTAAAVVIFAYLIFGLVGRLQRRITEQNEELSGLIEVGKAATTSLDLDELLARTLDTVLGVTSSDAAEIWLADGEEMLTLAIHRGLSPDAFAERTSFRIGEGVPGIVAETREMLLVHDLAADKRFLRRRVTDAGFNTFCAMPLLYRDTLVGVLAVASLNEDSMTQDWELRLLEGIVERVALAVENARLHQQVQDTAILQERERIAREMHDGVGQILGYMNTQTLAVKKLVSNEKLEDATAGLDAMQEVTHDLYADVREGILGLRMGPNRDGGLIAALGEYVKLFEEFAGVETVLQVSDDMEPSSLQASTEIQLMRIIQEALTNVRKHASAKRADVRLDLHDGELRVTIVDDGEGFDPEHRARAGWPRFGLQTMRERAESIGGTFELVSNGENGTRVVVRIPIGTVQKGIA